MENTKNNQVLTVDELAVYLKIGRNSAYNLVRSGQIHSIRIGRLIRVPLVAVNAYLSQTDTCNDAEQRV